MDSIIQQGEKFINYNFEKEITKHLNWTIIIFCSIVLVVIITFFIISLKNRKKFQSKFQFIITLIFFISLFIISTLKLKEDLYYYIDNFTKAVLPEGVRIKAILRNGVVIVIRTILEIILTLILRRRTKENKYVKENNFILSFLYISFVINFYHIAYFLNYIN